MPIENKYMAAAAVIGFLVVLCLTGGSLYAAFGALALIAGNRMGRPQVQAPHRAGAETHAV